MSFFANRSSRHAARLGPFALARRIPPAALALGGTPHGENRRKRNREPLQARKPVLESSHGAHARSRLPACGNGGGGGTPATGAPLDSLTHIIPGAHRPPRRPRPLVFTERPAGPHGRPLAANRGHTASKTMELAARESRMLITLRPEPRFEMDIAEGQEEGETTTEFPVPARLSYVPPRDEVAEAWLHYFIMPIGCYAEHNCYRTDVVGDSYERPSAAEFFKRTQGVFAQDYGLSPYSNDWPGVSTAQTKEICYSGLANYRACSPETIGNPESFFTREADQERQRTRPPHSGGDSITYVTSEHSLSPIQRVLSE